MELLRVTRTPKRWRKGAVLQVLRCAAFRSGSFVIGLSSGFVCRSELLFLLFCDFTATIHQVCRLLTSLTSEILHKFLAFIRLRTQSFTHFAASAGCI